MSTVETCESEQLCSLGLQDTPAQCRKAVCQVDELFCDGASMKVCSSGQDSFEEIHKCPTADACERGLAFKACRECTYDTDCQGETTACQWPECVNLSCTTGFAQEGTITANQTAHDCSVRVCDGRGAEVERIDDSDAPSSSLPCQTPVCEGGLVIVQHAAQGEPCENGGHCDGQGTCSSCTPGQVGACADSSTQTRCNSLGVWENVACPELKGRCYSEDGQCYGGGTLVWGAGTNGKLFGIDSTEVTRSQYEKWLNSNPALDNSTECQWNDTFVPSEGWPPGANGQFPVVGVDWCDARAYCVGVGKRICGNVNGGAGDFWSFQDPNVSQWYRVCSSSGTHNYPYGGTVQVSSTDGYDPTACNGEQADGEADEVATNPGCDVNGSQFSGVFDLSGNVSEWEDACNETDGYPCLVRGGYYSQNASRLACADQSFRSRDYRGADVGIRCCTP